MIKQKITASNNLVIADNLLADNPRANPQNPAVASNPQNLLTFDIAEHSLPDSPLQRWIITTGSPPTYRSEENHKKGGKGGERKYP